MNEIDAQTKRIADIIGDPELTINSDTLSTYLNYLQANLEQPCLLTGIEDFSWEERYIFGYGSKTEYEKLRKTRPSYRDTFQLISFDEGVDDLSDLLVKVRRTSDGKVFTIPMSELKAVDEKSTNYKLLNDFSVWIVNYQ